MRENRDTSLVCVALPIAQPAEHDRLPVLHEHLGRRLAGRDHGRVEEHLRRRLIYLLLDQEGDVAILVNRGTDRELGAHVAVLNDLVSGRRPEIDFAFFGP